LGFCAKEEEEEEKEEEEAEDDDDDEVEKEDVRQRGVELKNIWTINSYIHFSN
jgi:hypothetical protein